jgi:hypothetical protein
LACSSFALNSSFMIALGTVTDWGVLRHSFFPLLSIEFLYTDFCRLRAIQAVGHYSIAFGIRPWDVERLDPALGAKHMLGLVGIESVRCQGCMPCHKLEVVWGYDKVPILLLHTYTAIAINRFNVLWSVNFKLDRAAVTTALISCHFSHDSAR